MFHFPPAPLVVLALHTASLVCNAGTVVAGRGRNNCETKPAMCLFTKCHVSCAAPKGHREFASRQRRLEHKVRDAVGEITCGITLRCLGKLVDLGIVMLKCFCVCHKPCSHSKGFAAAWTQESWGAFSFVRTTGGNPDSLTRVFQSPNLWVQATGSLGDPI